MISKIKDKWNNLDKPNKIEIGLLTILLIACYLLFNHADLLCTSTHGNVLLDLTLKGKFTTFYDYTQSTAVYLIPIYIIFAIWSIPVKIIYTIFNIPFWGKFNYGNMPFLTQLWYKLLPITFCFGTAFILWKIAKLIKMDENKRKWMIFTFIGFPILVFVQFIFGQYDSINMFFTTLALYYFLQRKYYKFSISMSMAISLKLFPIFIFIPMVLMVEKRIFHILKHIVIGLATTVFSNILFIGSPGFNHAKEFTNDMINRFFTAGIPTAHGTISYFLLIVIFACVICYIKEFNENNKKEFEYYTIYICLLIYSSFFTLVLWHPQWVILLIPFWVISMFMFENIKVNYILSIFLGLSYLFNTVIYFPGNVDESMLNMGIIPRLFDKTTPRIGGIKNLFVDNPYFTLDTFMTIFGAVLIINLILKFPTQKRLENYKNGIKEKMPEKGYILGLIAVILTFISLSLLIFKQNNSSVIYQNVYGSSVSEPIIVKENNEKITNLKGKFNVVSIQFATYARINKADYKLIVRKNNILIYEELFDSSILKDGRYQEFIIPNTKTKKTDTIEIEVKPIYADNNNCISIYYDSIYNKNNIILKQSNNEQSVKKKAVCVLSIIVIPTLIIYIYDKNKKK